MSYAANSSHVHVAHMSRKRHVSAIEWVVLSTLAIALIAAAAGSATSLPHHTASASLRVRTGDTPWSIAASHPIDGLSTAQTADLIIGMNNIDGAYLVAGDSILVPTTSEDDTLAMR